MKKLLYGTLVAVISFVLVGFGAPSAAFANGDVSTILANTNAARAANNLSPLTLNSAMSAVAQAWSEQQAAEANMYHNPNYSTQIPSGWKRAGENVAYGYSVSGVVDAWMNSPGHRANILGDFDNIGIGSYGSYYTQVFAKYGAGSQPLNPPAPPPPPPPAPAPSPSTPAPAPAPSTPAPGAPTPAPSQDPEVTPPGEPRISSVETRATQFTVLVQGPASDGGALIESFVVTLKLGDELIEEQTLTESGEVEFTDLTPETTYTVVATVTNSAGSSERSFEVTTLRASDPARFAATDAIPDEGDAEPGVERQSGLVDDAPEDEGVPVLIWVAIGTAVLLIGALSALIYVLNRRKV